MFQKFLRTRLVSVVARQAIESNEKRVWLMTSSGSPYGSHNFISSKEPTEILVSWTLVSKHDSDIVRRLQVFQTTIKGASAVIFVDSHEDHKLPRHTWLNAIGIKSAPTFSAKTKIAVASTNVETLYQDPVNEARKRLLDLVETGKWVSTTPLPKSDPSFKRFLMKVTSLATAIR